MGKGQNRWTQCNCDPTETANMNNQKIWTHKKKNIYDLYHPNTRTVNMNNNKETRQTKENRYDIYFTNKIKKKKDKH